jgi:hypothetical protein
MKGASTFFASMSLAPVPPPLALRFLLRPQLLTCARSPLAQKALLLRSLWHKSARLFSRVGQPFADMI